MTLMEFLELLDGSALYPLDLIDEEAMQDWLERHELRQDTPLPTWNEEAQAWEI